MPEPHDDVAEFRWFAPSEIPDDDLAFPHTREVISAGGRSTSKRIRLDPELERCLELLGPPSTAARPRG